MTTLNNNKEQRNSILFALICYLIWGFQPLYFSIKADTDSMFLLMSRILWGCVLVVGIILVQGKGREILETFRDKELMIKHLIPAAIFNFLDWGIYMWAVMNNHILDTSLGYYVGPLIVCFLGVIFFKEKVTWESIVAILLIALGIVLSGSGFGTAPWVTISLMFCFSFYAAFMKGVKRNAIACTAVQLIMMAPIALGYILIFRMDENGIGGMNLHILLFLIGAGVVTALPILIYASCVKKLPLQLMGFMQYLCPTFGILCSYLLHEYMTHQQLISYIFIWAGVILYSVVTAVRSKKP